jgi:hypothetical protein
MPIAPNDFAIATTIARIFSDRHYRGIKNWRVYGRLEFDAFFGEPTALENFSAYYENETGEPSQLKIDRIKFTTLIEVRSEFGDIKFTVSEARAIARSEGWID